MIDFDQNILSIQLIGLECDITYNKVTFTGIIELETKKTVHLRTIEGIKVLPKDLCLISFIKDGYYYQIDGKKLIGRHEDRIKRKIKRKW